MKNGTKIILVFFVIFIASILIPDVEAADNVTLTIPQKIEFKSMEDLKDVDQDWYQYYRKLKASMHTECSNRFGEDYKYFISKADGYDVSLKLSSGICFNSETNKIKPVLQLKGTSLSSAQMSFDIYYDNYAEQAIFFHDNSANHAFKTNKTTSHTLYVSTDISKLEDMIVYFDSNIDYIFDATDYSNNKLVDYIQLNNIIYAIGDVIISNNSQYNPDEPPSNSKKEEILIDSDDYSYMDWSINPDKVYSDVWFILNDDGHYGMRPIEFTYTLKGSDVEKTEIIESKNGQFKHRFSKSFLKSLNSIRIKLYLPYQVENHRYKMYWYNAFMYDDNSEMTDSIFYNHDMIRRSDYKTVDLTNKYAVQLVFKKTVNPRFNYLEFHVLGNYNYYFKKQYGQSTNVIDNSSFLAESIELIEVDFGTLKYITEEELKEHISLFFVNKEYKNNSVFRSLIRYDSDMFDVIVFENEWDNKEYTTPNGDKITLQPPSNINPDGSDAGSKNLLEEFSISNILEHSFDAMTSLFKVFNLVGQFVYALFLSMPSTILTVYLWYFTVGIIILVIKLLH
ncbi:MAG: hypothetical protein HFG15_03685 [Bacilli bacterium]|nr:hypothetical protein [Bacilli bacterium]